MFFNGYYDLRCRTQVVKTYQLLLRISEHPFPGQMITVGDNFMVELLWLGLASAKQGGGSTASGRVGLIFLEVLSTKNIFFCDI